MKLFLYEVLNMNSSKAYQNITAYFNEKLKRTHLLKNKTLNVGRIFYQLCSNKINYGLDLQNDARLCLNKLCVG